jgi:hypothetical protein
MHRHREAGRGSAGWWQPEQKDEQYCGPWWRKRLTTFALPLLHDAVHVHVHVQRNKFGQVGRSQELSKHSCHCSC